MNHKLMHPRNKLNNPTWLLVEGSTFYKYVTYEVTIKKKLINHIPSKPLRNQSEASLTPQPTLFKEGNSLYIF